MTILIVIAIIIIAYFIFSRNKQNQSESLQSRTTGNNANRNYVSSKREEKKQNVQNIKRYFNGFADLQRFSINGNIFVDPYTGTNMEMDVSSFSMLIMDKETSLYMHDFSGFDVREKLPIYLMNTVECTKMGIAFGYSIRLNRGLIGFVKITTPSHNKVTNNFDGWLIDYIMLPMFRGKKIMKNVVPYILDIVKDLGADKIYAMVDPDNKASIHLLNKWGFVNTHEECSENEMTGNNAILYVKSF